MPNISEATQNAMTPPQAEQDNAASATLPSYVGQLPEVSKDMYAEIQRRAEAIAKGIPHNEVPSVQSPENVMTSSIPQTEAVPPQVILPVKDTTAIDNDQQSKNANGTESAIPSIPINSTEIPITVAEAEMHANKAQVDSKQMPTSVSETIPNPTIEKQNFPFITMLDEMIKESDEKVTKYKEDIRLAEEKIRLEEAEKAAIEGVKRSMHNPDKETIRKISHLIAQDTELPQAA